MKPLPAQSHCGDLVRWGKWGIPIQKRSTMINHIILTVSDVERSLAFYEAALKPLNIQYFMPYKG
ncbi:MAG: hypothetical protein WB950_09790, partial [Acidobacteriaceae bacterium]